MANCVCWICKRPMDCTGETMCDLCEIDSLSATEEAEDDELLLLTERCRREVANE